MYNFFLYVCVCVCVCVCVGVCVYIYIYIHTIHHPELIITGRRSLDIVDFTKPMTQMSQSWSSSSLSVTF